MYVSSLFSLAKLVSDCIGFHHSTHPIQRTVFYEKSSSSVVILAVYDNLCISCYYYYSHAGNYPAAFFLKGCSLNWLEYFWYFYFILRNSLKNQVINQKYI